MNDITTPLRLAVGSHTAGSGKGCAMNVISWETGESTISDMPACADPLLAKIVQRVNDTHCDHVRDGLLCPPCSLEVLELAHRTVGTALVGWTPERVARVHVTIAVEEAESVLGLTTSEAPRRAVVLVRRWLDGEDIFAGELRAAAYAAANAAANAADADAAAYAADAAYAAAYAAADAAADAANAAYAAAYAAYADANAAYAAAYAAANAAYAAANAANAARLARAHRVIDRFEELTGVTAQPPSPEVVQEAYCKMVSV